MAAGKSGEDCVTIGAVGTEQSPNVAVGGHDFSRRDETTTLHLTPPDAHRVVAERIREGRLFFWCDPADRPVSMAGWAGRTPNGVRVNFVYTPPESRNRGYATSCVAALTKHLLDCGRTFCFLFTDMANPTSNRIYRQIGYQHVCDMRDVRFEPPGDSRHH